jgi:uncharacterized protein (DUF58 family)
MNDLGPRLRQRLTRARLLAGDAVARGGVGERRSRTKGEGIEFEEHRPYQPGDDFRRLDPQLYARLGEPFVRQYNVSQQLNVTLLLDASRSMAYGEPDKMAFARSVTAGLAYVALAGSDAVQVGVLSDGRVAWRGRQSGLGRIDELQPWLSQWSGDGTTDLGLMVSSVRDRLPARGLAIAVSDWWSTSALDAVDTLAAAGQSVVVLQVLAPDEVHPERSSVRGSLRLVDVETDEEIELTLGDAQLARYGRLLGEYTDRLRERVHAARGRFVRLTTDLELEEVFLRLLPRAGVLR